MRLALCSNCVTNKCKRPKDGGYQCAYVNVALQLRHEEVLLARTEQQTRNEVQVLVCLTLAALGAARLLAPLCRALYELSPKMLRVLIVVCTMCVCRYLDVVDLVQVKGREQAIRHGKKVHRWLFARLEAI